MNYGILAYSTTACVILTFDTLLDFDCALIWLDELFGWWILQMFTWFCDWHLFFPSWKDSKNSWLNGLDWSGLNLVFNSTRGLSVSFYLCLKMLMIDEFIAFFLFHERNVLVLLYVILFHPPQGVPRGTTAFFRQAHWLLTMSSFE